MRYLALPVLNVLVERRDGKEMEVTALFMASDSGLRV